MSRLRGRFGLLMPALAGLVLLLAACDGDDDDGILDDMLNDTTPTPAAETPTPTPAVDDDADPAGTPEPAEPEPTNELRADIEEVDGSGVTGELHVVAYNGQSEVTVDATGLDENEEYTAQLRSGSCGDEDPGLAFPLGALEVDADGSANLTEELEVGFGLLSNTHLTIEFAAEEEGATGDVVACADLDEDDTDDGLLDDENGLDDEDEDGLD